MMEIDDTFITEMHDIVRIHDTSKIHMILNLVNKPHTQSGRQIKHYVNHERDQMEWDVNKTNTHTIHVLLCIYMYIYTY